MSQPVSRATCLQRKRCSTSQPDFDAKRVCSRQQCPDSSKNNVNLFDLTLFESDPAVQKTNLNDLNINDLPVLILMKIFKNLSLSDRQHHVALVCQYWLQLSRDPQLWKCVHVRGQRKITDALLRTITGYCKAVTELDVSDCNLTDESVAMVLSSCPYLSKLQLARCTQVTNAAFTSIGVDNGGSSLKVLDVASCWLLTDVVLLQLSSTCHHLTRLIVNQCTELSDEGILAVARSLRFLQELSVDECVKLTDSGLNGIITSCHQLTLFSCKFCNFSANVTSQCSKLRKLVSLDVTGVKAVDNQVVLSIVDNCDALKSLYLSLCEKVSDEGVAYIAQRAKRLTTLHLVSCSISDEALGFMERYCHERLEVLDIGYCFNVTNAGVCLLVDSCRRLRYLGLMRCDSISNATVACLVDKHPTISFSTVFLEMKRLLDAAQLQGPHNLDTQ